MTPMTSQIESDITEAGTEELDTVADTFFGAYGTYRDGIAIMGGSETENGTYWDDVVVGTFCGTYGT